ncbi:MAG: alpha/beta hydrolase [Chloroflexota bacterium]|nr:alpha/beta hydrolase [Chloroflexota bacterium]
MRNEYPYAQPQAPGPLQSGRLGEGIRTRIIGGVNGLRMHVLESGANEPGRACVLLLHGFPEIAFSWRRILPALAAAGYYAVAPDLRGYGRTGPAHAEYSEDLRPYFTLNLVRDIMALLDRLGRRRAVLVGHDFGTTVAGWAALARPDRFPGLVHMSGPFPGSPDRVDEPSNPVGAITPDLARLDPPRLHYQYYYRRRRANAEMLGCPQGLHAFLRGYYHFKSGDHPQNKPFRLAGWTAGEVAKMPRYYVMDKGRTMAETVAAEMPNPAQIASCRWLPDEDLAVYAAEYARSGFQGGLNGYRCGASPAAARELQLFAEVRLQVPCLFVAGAADWGVYQRPGALERLKSRICTDLRGVTLIPGAGHWVQQEAAEEVNGELLDFLTDIDWLRRDG